MWVTRRIGRLPADRKRSPLHRGGDQSDWYGGTASMSGSNGHRRILGITPFAAPDAALAVAVARAGATGVLDLGADREAALLSLSEATEWWRGPLGVRVGAACSVTPGELPAS